MSKITIKASLASHDLPIDEFVNLLQNVFPNSFWNHEYFIWKHFDNPFGPSILVWAVCQNKVIGFRALWHMPFCAERENIVAYQPCDTAVLAAYRGKGIFSDMTKLAKSKAIELGAKLIFNFPNTMSVRGYLKLGWYHQAKINRFLMVCRPFSVLKKSYLSKWWRNSFVVGHPESPVTHDNLRQKYWINAHISGIHYKRDELLWKWRFLQNPKATYGAVINGNDCLIYRVGYFSDLKFVELLVWSNYDFVSLKPATIKKLRKLEDPDIISVIADNCQLVRIKGGVFINVPNNLRFVGINLGREKWLEKLVFEPLLYDTI